MDINVDSHQRRMILACAPEDWRLRTKWLKFVEDVLRPIRQPLDSEVMSALRLASQRLTEKPKGTSR